MENKIGFFADDYENVMPQKRIHLFYGANEIDFDLEDKKLNLGQIQIRMKEILNLEGDEITLVNGKKIDRPNDYFLQGTEMIEFVRKAGQKG